MNTIKNYLATAGMTAAIAAGEGCVEQSFPFPEASIQRVAPSEIGAQTSALIRDAVMKCIEGTFSQKDFNASRDQLGKGTNSAGAKNINVVCESGPKAEIQIGIRGLCTSSLETSNGKDYVMGKVDCAAGY